MTKRYPICNHTLSAVRGRKPAFRIAAEAIAGRWLDATTLRNLVDAAEMAFAEIDAEEMPMQSESHKRIV